MACKDNDTRKEHDRESRLKERVAEEQKVAAEVAAAEEKRKKSNQQQRDRRGETAKMQNNTMSPALLSEDEEPPPPVSTIRRPREFLLPAIKEEPVLPSTPATARQELTGLQIEILSQSRQHQRTMALNEIQKHGAVSAHERAAAKEDGAAEQEYLRLALGPEVFGLGSVAVDGGLEALPCEYKCVPCWIFVSVFDFV